MDNLSRLIAEHPFLEGMSPEHVKFLTGCASNVVFKPGEYLFREGGPADHIYLIRFGEVSVQAYAPGAGATTILTCGEGEVVGWSWVIEPFRSHFDILALTQVRAIAFDAVCLRDKCLADHELGYHMLRRVVALMELRLKATRIQLLDVYATTR